MESTPGPVCFPKTASTPVPTSPSRFANPQDVKPHVGAEPSNGSSDLASGKPLSSSSNSSNNNIALDPSLGQSQDGNNQARPVARAGQPSFLKNTGDGVIRTPGPGQMVSPKEAFRDYEDILKRRPQPQMQGSPRQQQQQGSPMQQPAQYKQPQQPQRDIQVPQMNLPQMPPPLQPQQQQQQNSFQAQLQQPPPPGQSFDGTDAQLLAALGGSHAMPHQGSPQNRAQQLPASQQQQQQQRGMQQMGTQGSPQQQRQLQTQPAPQPMSTQQQNAARQAAYQGFMAHPPPTGANSSTDIQVPQSNAPTSNVGTPSAGQSSLPPLPNYQSAPAPLAFNDGSFFSHQAILASLAAEEQAKAAAAAAAVMGFQNGTWNGASGGNGQQQQNGGANQGQYNFAQPGQPQQQGQNQQGQQQGGQLPPFAGAPGTSSVLGDFSFEQHFGPPPPAGNSPDASTSSRKRIKGKSGSRGTLSRSNSTTSNNGSSGRHLNSNNNKAMVAEARALQGGQYGGAFNFGAFANNNNNNNNTLSSNNEVDAEGEEEEDTKPQFNSRGIQKRKSASAARELAQAQQKDHTEEYEYQGYVPKGSGSAGGVLPPGSVPPSAGLGASGIGGGAADDSDDSDDDDGDEWVAEESDDSYGKKRKGGNKRSRKSMGSKNASLTPAEAEALRAASPTTAAAALASVNSNGQFDFTQLMGDYSVGSPDSASGGTPGGSSKKRKSNAAAPGSGNISCDYVDPKTGERCPVKFRRPYDQARHMETVHSGTAEKSKWACITCKKSFSRKDALIRHGRISNHATM